uniref:Uncharacterized protein n=1 Tax=Anguilla anguilla TaxID=7936 RepID=A0A0E9PME7_ANGAN
MIFKKRKEYSSHMGWDAGGLLSSDFINLSPLGDYS